MHFLAHWFGVGSTTNTAYSFWSGSGSCLTYLGILGTALHHVNCHAKGCYRVGRHLVAGTPYKVCRRHHPDIPDKGATTAQIGQAYKDD